MWSWSSENRKVFYRSKRWFQSLCWLLHQLSKVWEQFSSVVICSRFGTFVWLALAVLVNVPIIPNKAMRCFVNGLDLCFSLFDQCHKVGLWWIIWWSWSLLFGSSFGFCFNLLYCVIYYVWIFEFSDSSLDLKAKMFHLHIHIWKFSQKYIWSFIQASWLCLHALYCGTRILWMIDQVAVTCLNMK